jgi:DNA-binding transcriptional MerR regulator
MRISELSRESGVPVPTIKYYLREGLLPAGTPTSATSASYDERHVDRLNLIRALVDVGRLPIARVREVVTALEQPPTSWHDLLGAAHGALPPAAGGAVRDTAEDADVERPAVERVAGGDAPPVVGTQPVAAAEPSVAAGDAAAGEAAAGDALDETGAARAAVRQLGWQVHPQSPVLRELQRALDAVTAVGLAMTPERLATYAAAAAMVAEADVASVPTDSAERATRHVVVGTVLYEPVLLALRRLAHEDASARRFGEERR